MKSTEFFMLLPCAMIAFMVIVLVGSSWGNAKEQVIEMTAKRFEYNPNKIVVRKGVPVLLEVRALDRVHGFQAPDLGIDTTLAPGKVNEIRFTPEKTGEFPFHCSVFCGDGHSDMMGEIVVN